MSEHIKYEWHWLPEAQSFFERKLRAGVQLAQWAFEHIPTSDFGRSDRGNVVNVAERCHQLVAGSFPESSVEVLEPNETMHLTREDHPEVYEQIEMYFGGKE